MKKKCFGFVTFFMAVGIFISAQPVPEQEQEPVREEVKVVNVEVPVRVFLKGKPVDNLSRDDFKLYEGKTLQVINGFNIKRKKIKLQEIGLEVEKIQPSRYFVLVYRVTQYSPPMKEGLKHIFDNVLTERDELRVFVNNKNLYFANLGNKQACYSKVDRVISGESANARQLMNAYFKKLEQQIDKTRFDLLIREMGGGGGGGGDAFRRRTQALMQFLKRYLQVFREYKKRYLLPDINSYYNFARHLEGVRKEKWVINFYQMEMFPQLAMSGKARRTIRRFISELRSSTNPEDKAYSRILDRQLMEIDRELNVAEAFPAEAISKIFYKVDATFHSIFMRSTLGIISQDYTYKAVSTDIENSLREITKATGGTLVTTNNLVQAMDSIGEKENVYYLLTYAPDNPDKIGKIKIKVSNKKYKVIYDDNMRADYINAYLSRKETVQPRISGSAIQITDLKFTDSKLSISVTGYYMRKISRGRSGRMEIRIRIKNIQGISIFDQSKTLDLKKPDITITLPFKNLKRGKYDIVVDAQDLLTNKSDTKLIQPRIR
ncbi:MAG: hypothetical protein KAT34_05975 [Candidatus Aminicenantes bacterium]|nr:hypothetical protein [Candidatus Aminicenantes bacterium]